MTLPNIDFKRFEAFPVYIAEAGEGYGFPYQVIRLKDQKMSLILGNTHDFCIVLLDNGEAYGTIDKLFWCRMCKGECSDRPGIEEELNDALEIIHRVDVGSPWKKVSQIIDANKGKEKMDLPNIDFTKLTAEDPELEDKVIKLIDEHINKKHQNLDDNLRSLSRKLVLSTVIPNIIERLLRSGK